MLLSEIWQTLVRFRFGVATVFYVYQIIGTRKLGCYVPGKDQGRACIKSCTVLCSYLLLFTAVSVNSGSFARSFAHLEKSFIKKIEIGTSWLACRSGVEIVLLSLSCPCFYFIILKNSSSLTMVLVSMHCLPKKNWAQCFHTILVHMRFLQKQMPSYKIPW